MGGYFSCKTEGNYLLNGVCQCKPGFNGIKCLKTDCK